MFRDDDQAGRVARILCMAANRPNLWGPNNRPTDDLVRLAERKTSKPALWMTPAEHGMVMLAMLVWNRTNDQLPVKLSFLFRLDDMRLRMVGELLVAVAGQPAALDAWCARWDRP